MVVLLLLRHGYTVYILVGSLLVYPSNKVCLVQGKHNEPWLIISQLTTNLLTHLRLLPIPTQRQAALFLLCIFLVWFLKIFLVNISKKTSTSGHLFIGLNIYKYGSTYCIRKVLTMSYKECSLILLFLLCTLTSNHVMKDHRHFYLIIHWLQFHSNHRNSQITFYRKQKSPPHP